jgi:hypothetical protein
MQGKGKGKARATGSRVKQGKGKAKARATGGRVKELSHLDDQEDYTEQIRLAEQQAVNYGNFHSSGGSSSRAAPPAGDTSVSAD